MMELRSAYEFVVQHKLAVVASVSEGGIPEAALIEIAVTPTLELIFDTLDTTRKCINLRRNPNIAVVVGWSGGETLQLDGLADEPANAEREQIKSTYFAQCPGGLSREGWPGLTYFRIRPHWLRLSNYARPRRIDELRLADPVPIVRKRGLFGWARS
jgi:hypothetical protein